MFVDRKEQTKKYITVLYLVIEQKINRWTLNSESLEFVSSRACTCCIARVYASSGLSITFWDQQKH